MKFDENSPILKVLKTPGFVRGSVFYNYGTGQKASTSLAMNGQTSIHEIATALIGGEERTFRVTKVEPVEQSSRFNVNRVKEYQYVLNLTLHEYIVQELVHVVNDE